ncbi:DUF6701 domain-containing protein [Marinobacter salicampi]|uniref:DUF6701 domain-containing protein n=1 Tax=Marinobacter salicampi TaxID=435907 RepID=UPI00140BFBA5|nr:DUF6701 domain-containing protein [Marinobacter salicampi]
MTPGYLRLWIVLLSLASAPAAGVVILSGNGDPVGPVTVNVGDTVAFEVTATECSNVQGGNSVWRDSWSNAGEPEEQVFASSPCSVPSFGRTFSYSTAGTYTVSYTSEYCRNLRFWGCATGWEDDQGDDIVIIVIDPSALTCFQDSFSVNTLDPDNWVTSVSRGNFTPGVASNGRMRMTEAVSNQATAATMQREIPAADNLIILEFNYFAYGGNGADGLAIALSDAAVTPQPGSYGGSLGYAQRNNGDPGFAGGWLGIGLDEYGNFSNSNEGRIGGPGFRRDAVAIRGAAPQYRYLAGTNSLTPGIDQPNIANPAPHRYRITVDSRLSNQALVSVERDLTATGTAYQTLVAPFDAVAQPGQPAVPESFLLSLTGSTGGSNNIHELDNVQLCAQKLNPVGAQVDHFEIVHDGTALTCQPEAVTIRACADADCSTLFTDPVSATMSPSGWVGGDTVTITEGVTTTAMLRHTTAETVVLDVVGSQPSTRPQSTTLCQVGGSGLSAANCNLTFHAAGLSFDVPDLVANRTSGSIQVSAVRQDDASQACVPAFADVTRDVSFWSTFVEPGGGGLSAMPSVSVSGSEVGQSPAAATALPLSFNSSGVAEIEVHYPEAGQMQIEALYSGTSATEDEGLTMPGADLFVSVPAGFCIEATEAAAACTGTQSECSVLTAAGDPFDVSIRAVAWETPDESGAQFCTGNGITRNFRITSLTLGHELVEPIGGAAGALGVTAVEMTAADAGVVAFSQDVSEVGVFALEVPAGQPYLGSSLPKGQSDAVGRFTPAFFDIGPAATIDGILAATCDAGTAFSYTGEAMGWSLAPDVQIRALNRDGSITTNYTHEDFRKLAAIGVSRTLPTRDDAQLLSDGSDLVPVTYVSAPATLLEVGPGVLSYGFSQADKVAYDKLESTRLAPFTPDLTLSIDNIQDADGVAGIGLPRVLSPQSSFEMRYGRLAMQNVFGPENIPALEMPLQVEYWNGGRFELNTVDNGCTGWSTTDITGSNDHHSLEAGAGSVAGGIGGPLVLEPSGTQGTDTLVMDVDDWLKDFWNGSATLENPSALATFGVYRGHDRVIDWRER